MLVGLHRGLASWGCLALMLLGQYCRWASCMEVNKAYVRCPSLHPRTRSKQHALHRRGCRFQRSSGHVLKRVDFCGKAACAAFAESFGKNVIFHARTTGASDCLVEACADTTDGDSSWYEMPPADLLGEAAGWETFATMDLCPQAKVGMAPEIFPEKCLWLQLGHGPESDREQVMRMFGAAPMLLKRTLGKVYTTCNKSFHAFFAEVCDGAGECDDWAKFSLKGCSVPLGMPYSVMDSDMYRMPNDGCMDHGMMYCPATAPMAIQVTLKAGSRSARLWAAHIEGLVPGVVMLRQTHSSLGIGAIHRGNFTDIEKLQAYMDSWYLPEVIGLGCSNDEVKHGVYRVMQGIRSGIAKLPMSMCTTCCRTGAGRLRVVMMRNPFARLASYYYSYWRKGEGHKLSGPLSFTTFVEELHRTGTPTAVFNAAALQHVQPTFTSWPTWKHWVPFVLEDPEASQRRLEELLCAPPFHYCLPLPSLPITLTKKYDVEVLSETASALVRERYHIDFAIIAQVVSSKVAS